MIAPGWPAGGTGRPGGAGPERQEGERVGNHLVLPPVPRPGIGASRAVQEPGQFAPPPPSKSAPHQGELFYNGSAEWHGSTPTESCVHTN